MLEVRRWPGGRESVRCAACGLHGDYAELERRAAWWSRGEEASSTESNTPDLDPEQLLAAYLKAHGWPSSVVADYELSIVRDSHGAPRVRYPHRWPDRVRYYADRALEDGARRWIHSPDGPTLYNVRALEQRTPEIFSIVVCADPEDVIATELALKGVEHVAVIGAPGSRYKWPREYADALAGCEVVTVIGTRQRRGDLAASIEHAIGRSVARVELDAPDATSTARGELRTRVLPRVPTAYVLHVLPGSTVTR